MSTNKVSKEFLELSEKITDIENEPTITVSDWFGKDKEVTRKEYIDLWVKNADLYKLVDYTELVYMEAWVQEIKDDIAELAGYSWDIVYKRKLKREDKNGKSKS